MLCLVVFPPLMALPGARVHARVQVAWLILAGPCESRAGPCLIETPVVHGVLNMR